MGSDEPKGFISAPGPFVYHPKTGCYTDLQNHLLDAMRRFSVFLFVIGTSFRAAAAGLISEADLVGTWKIDAATFKVRELATPNSFPRPQLPPEYKTFALTLRKDGTFLLTNAPAGFFLLSVVSETGGGSGKWSARTNWPARLPAAAERLPKNPKDAYITLNLEFDTATNSEMGWSSIIYEQTEEEDSRQPSLSFGPFKDKTQTYEWKVLVTKQKGI
jgi:hypothetical protein